MEKRKNKKIQNEWERLTSLKQLIFALCKENIIQSSSLIMNKFVDEYPFSYNLIISQMIYAFPITMMNDIDLYLNLIKEIETFEENGKCKSKFIDVFKDFLLSKDTQESSYILENMVKKKFIELNHSQVLHNLYFAHYVTEEELKIYFFDMCMNEVQKNFFDNYDELSKNNWKLHKKLIEEGHNPNKILKIIRNDEIEKFQKISSQTNFNIDQEVVPSLYERCSFINQYGVKLIDYAAFFGSIKCFKYLLLNGANLSNTSKYAIASGNLEIIHICEQNNSSFKDAYETAIKFHKNDIFKYIYENKLEKINLEEIGIKCILYHNYEIFSFLLEEGMEIHDSIINESAKIGNIFLLKHFLNEYHIPNDILIFSVESGNIELVQYVLEQKDVDINTKGSNGWTSLILASINNYIEIVKLLLKQDGIDINVKDDKGRTALIYASLYGCTEIIELLLKQNEIDINTKDLYENSALIVASAEGYKEIVKLLLLQKDIDVNSKDRLGYTALMYAVKYGYNEIIKLLLEQKDISFMDKIRYLWKLKFKFFVIFIAVIIGVLMLYIISFRI